MPFAFHIELQGPELKPGGPSRLVISRSIEEDILLNTAHAFTEEDVFVVHCSPQSVFKVRPATRCSSTLSGTYYTLYLRHALRIFSHRAHIPDPLCILLPHRQPPRNRLRRHARTFMGSPHRNAIAHTHRAQGVGALRRMGGHGAKTRHWGTRRPRPPMGSENRQTDRRCAQGTLKMGDLARLGADTSVRTSCYFPFEER